MKELKNLKDLFKHHMKDVYSAETQLIEALPKMKEKASNKDLKNALTEHLEETKRQKQRLDELAKTMDMDISGVTCEAMKGLVKEAKSFVSEDADEDVRDAGIIADAQRIEHYEISAYGTLIHYAKGLKEDEAINTLSEILDEEKHADSMLNKIAIDNVNVQAKNKVNA